MTFYKYTVTFFDEEIGDEKIESGLIIGEDYSDASARLQKVYSNMAIFDLYLTRIDNDMNVDGIGIITDEELKEEFSIKK